MKFKYTGTNSVGMTNGRIYFGTLLPGSSFGFQDGLALVFFNNLNTWAVVVNINDFHPVD